MGTLSEEYAYFLKALGNELSKKGWGSQAELAQKTKVSEACISAIRSGKKHASFDTQVRIAENLGFDYIEFLTIGKAIHESRPLELGPLAPKVAGLPEAEANEVLQSLSFIRNADKAQYYRLLGKIEALAEFLGDSPSKSNDEPGSKPPGPPHKI